jgi:hypothetical protein
MRRAERFVSALLRPGSGPRIAIGLNQSNRPRGRQTTETRIHGPARRESRNSRLEVS